MNILIALAIVLFVIIPVFSLLLWVLPNWVARKLSGPPSMRLPR